MPTILVVDDSPTELRLVTGALQRRGYDIVTATDGDEALAKAASARPDLIVLDVVMPKKNGFQVCRELKTAPETKDLKVLLLTSKNQPTDRFWGLKQGADEYMTKPFDEAALIAAVKKFV
jgi:twitching motility two-component system response regulator PilH